MAKKGTRRVSEKRLVDVLVSYLRGHQPVAREVAHYERRIDVATMCKNSAELWAIEAKTNDWSRALSQAVVNLAVAERSFIAIHSVNVHRVRRDDLKARGVGLISVGTKWGEVEILVDAPRSPFVNSLAAERVRAKVTSVGV